MATKEELIKENSKIRRTCLGNPKEGVREKIKAFIDEGNFDEARKLNVSGRINCGYDMNKVILAGPFDGQRHKYKCPKCGVEGEFRNPVADEV